MTTSWTSPPSSSADPLPPEGTLAWRPGPPRPGDPEPPWPPVLVAEDLLEAGVVAAFTGRAGGTSGAPFATLNLALRVEDDPRRVLANRRRVATVLASPACLGPGPPGPRRHLLHVRAGKPGPGRPRVPAGGPGSARAAGGEADVGRPDGLVTADRGGAGVLTADCAPVLLADPGPGWSGRACRVAGLAAGVVEAGVAAMAELGADPGAVVGWSARRRGLLLRGRARGARGRRRPVPAALATTRTAAPPSTGRRAAQALERAGAARSGWRASAHRPGGALLLPPPRPGRTGRQAA